MTEGLGSQSSVGNEMDQQHQQKRSSCVCRGRVLASDLNVSVLAERLSGLQFKLFSTRCVNDICTGIDPQPVNTLMIDDSNSICS